MITITGATGRLGRLVIQELLERGVPASELIAIARDPQKAEDLAERGVRVRQADYAQLDTLPPAFKGARKLLLISSSKLGQRVEQHRNVVAAAQKVGVRLLAYTSIFRADTTAMKMAAEHKATEEIIRNSGLPFVLLRHSWYTENYTGNLEQTLQRGVILGSAGDGRISAAPRADYAAAAAAVLTSDGHENAMYELGGDEAFTMAELANEISAKTGTEVICRDLPVEEYRRVLVGAGLPEEAAAVYADADASVARGDLYTDSGDLSRLIGRPTIPLADAIAAALKP